MITTNSNIFFPEDYGAVCYNSSLTTATATDSWQAFNACMNAMSQGDVMQLQRGYYYLRENLVIKKNITIAGVQAYHQYASTDRPNVAGVTASHSWLIFNGLRGGIVAVINARVQDVALYGAGGGQSAPGPGKDGFRMRRTSKLQNVWIDSFGRHGVYVDTKALAGSIVGCRIVNNVATASLINNVDFYHEGMVVTTTGLSINTSASKIISASNATAQNGVTTLCYILSGVNGELIDQTGSLVTINDNCNNFCLQDVKAHSNAGDGFNTVGPDSNAGYGLHCDGYDNKGYGFYEASFLGNCWIACHTNGNDAGSYTKPDSADNNRSAFINCYAESNQRAPYVSWPAAPVKPGQGGWTGDGLAPSFNVGVNRAANFYNNNVNNYLAVTTTGLTVLNNTGTFTVGANHFIVPGMIVSSSKMSWNGSTSLDLTGSFLNKRNGLVISTGSNTVNVWAGLPNGSAVDPSGTLYVQNDIDFNVGGSTATIFGFSATGDGSGLPYKFQYLMNGSGVATKWRHWHQLRYNSINTGIAMAISSPRSRVSGFNSPVGVGKIAFPNGFYFGGGGETPESVAVYRQQALQNGSMTAIAFHDVTVNPPTRPDTIAWGTSAPTNGTWDVGAIVFNRRPAIGQPGFWMCVNAGTPGTWASGSLLT